MPPSGLSVIPAIASIEQMRFSREIDGSAGLNRATGVRSQIAANTDVDAVMAWLIRFADTKTTFENYRKEAERLLLWSAITLGKPLSSLTHEDLQIYQHFLADPQPSVRWIMANRKMPRGHPDWRPFAGPLSPSSQRQAMGILNALFSWLVNAGYLAGNPLSLSRHRQQKPQPRVTRFLEEDLWNEVKRAIEALPRDTNREREHYHRVRWLFSLFYIAGIRISEVVQNTMGGFFCRKDADGELRWWLEITGKGDKTRMVPATNELIIELSRYRREMGLSPIPIERDTCPLVLPIGGKQRFMTRSAIHTIVKAVFKLTADHLRRRGLEAANQVARLEAASAHWLRHTAGTSMAGSMDLRYVRDNLGHENLTTTSVYVHSEDSKRHEATEASHKLNW